jgi:hypothetical protein
MGGSPRAELPDSGLPPGAGARHGRLLAAWHAASPAASRWTGTASNTLCYLPSPLEDRWRVPRLEPRLVCPSRERRRPPSACCPASSPAPYAAPVACPACCPTCSVAWSPPGPAARPPARHRRRPPGRHRQRPGRCRRPPRPPSRRSQSPPHPGRQPAWPLRRPGPAPGCPPRLAERRLRGLAHLVEGAGHRSLGSQRRLADVVHRCVHRLEQRLQVWGLRSIVVKARSRMS